MKPTNNNEMIDDANMLLCYGFFKLKASHYYIY